MRARGCQFLGPAMQEEVLKLVLLALEEGSALSRKVNTSHRTIELAAILRKAFPITHMRSISWLKVANTAFTFKTLCSSKTSC